MKKLVITLLIGVNFGLQAQFISTFSNDMDHDFYSVESIGTDLIMAGTVYPTGQLTSTDIHVQRIDNNGNVLWEIYHNIGTDERCIDIALQGTDYILLTGSNLVNGRQRIFVMRLDQHTGAIVDVKYLYLGSSTIHVEQFGLQIIYSPSSDNYYVVGSATDNSVSGFWGGSKTAGLLICLDNGLNFQWAKEINNFGPSSIANGIISSIVDIPNKGIAIAGFAGGTSGLMMHFNYSGVLVWSLSGYPLGHPVKGLVFDQSTSKLYSVSASPNKIYLVEVSNATSVSASITNVADYGNLITSHQHNFWPEDIYVDVNTNTIKLFGFSYLRLGSPNKKSNFPSILSVDRNTLKAISMNITKMYNPGHLVRDDEFYSIPKATSTTAYWLKRGYTDKYARWGNGFALLSYNYSTNGGLNSNNNYNLSVVKADANGRTGLDCEEIYSFTTTFPSFVPDDVPTLRDVFYNINSYNSDDYYIQHRNTSDCYLEEPCNVSVNSIQLSQAISCLEAEFTTNVSVGSGTCVTQYFWDWGDGTTSITTTPYATHKFINLINLNCMSNVCVTISGTGSDGSICSDTRCLNVNLPFLATYLGFPCPNCGNPVPPINSQKAELRESEMEDTQLVLYPNPANSTITLNGFGKGEIFVTIMDLNGKIVLEKTASNNETIHLNNELGGGVYYIIARNNVYKLTEKLIILEE